MRELRPGSGFRTCLLVLATLLTTAARAGEIPEQEVKGTLTELRGIRVLRVRGTPWESGYAHGHFLAQDIIDLLDAYSADTEAFGELRHYEELVETTSRIMKVAPQYKRELRGMLAGIQNRLGDHAQIPTLEREPRYEDLVVLNCIFDTSQAGCSSFAVWGALTKDGGTITARNLDWRTVPSLQSTQVLLVRAPSADGERLGWVSLTWPGLIGCMTGMNTDGVTVSLHDVPIGAPDRESGFVPRTFMLRKAIELRCAEDPVYEIPRAMGRVPVVAACNVLVSVPSETGIPHAPAGVIEYVGRFNQEYDFGLRIHRARHCDGTRDSFVLCTNLFKEQQSGPDACDRFRILSEALVERSENGSPIDVETAWRLLAQVMTPRAGLEHWMTYQSVVFESNKRLMHVAFDEDGVPAPLCKKVTINVAKLLRSD